MSFTRVDDLLGAWRLESTIEVFDDGERRDEFGPNPEGCLCYPPPASCQRHSGTRHGHQYRPVTRKTAPTATTGKWPGTSSPTPGR